MLAKNAFPRATQMMTATSQRGFAYTADTKPFVFINEHTKVICQGMTGKHVSLHTQLRL